MTFSLSGIEKNGTESNLTVRIDSVYTDISLNETHLNYIKNDDLHFKLAQYNQSYSLHLDYKDREFIKLFELLNLSTESKSLVRCFALSSVFLDNISEYVLSGRFPTIDDLMERNFEGQLMIDWTARQNEGEVQPQQYFISRELVSKNKEEIEVLYRLGLLQKYNYRNVIEFSNFYIPVLIPEDDDIRALKPPKVWNAIVADMNSKVLRLTSGRTIA